MKNLNKRRNPVQALNRWQDCARHFLDTSLSRVFLLLVAGFLSTATVNAQNGNVAYPENSIDSRMRTSMHVDPISGALQFQITLGNYPGRAGAGLPIVLNYSSKLWRLEHISTFGGCDQWGYCYPQVSDYEAYFAESSAAGWTSNLDWFIWPSGASPIQTYDSLGRPADNMGQWQAARMFVRLPDGSKHELRRDDSYWSGYQPSGIYYAVDGSRLRYHTDTQTLWLPDGSRYVGSTQYIDRNGNTLTYNGASWTDTLGRTIGLPLPAFSTTGEQSQASARDEYYSIPGVGGASLTYAFKWRRLVDVRTDSGQALRPKGDRIVNSCLRVSSLFTSPGICGTDEDHRIISSEVFNPVVLHQVVLPNGSAYTFTYNIYGEIDKVVYPTGGYEKFTHDQVPALSADFTSDQIGDFYAQANRGVTEQWISADGTQGSEVGPFSPGIAPDGTRTERYVHRSQGQIAYGFDDPRAGLIYDERVLAPNNGPMLRRKLTEWAVDGTVEYYGPRLMYKTRNPRPAREVEIILDTGGNALAATTTYQYDADLNVISSNRYAFVEVDQTTAQNGAISAIPSGSLVRIEETDYLTNNQAYRDRNLLSLPTATRIKNAAGTIITQSQILYDEAAYPLLTCGAASGWSDPGTSARGNATTTSSWLNTTGSYLQTHAQHDQCGNLRNAWDAKGNQSQIEYSSAYNYAYPTLTRTAIPDPAGQHGSSAAFVSTSSYDSNTGFVTSTVDANNVTTTLEYNDVLNRSTRTVRASGTAQQSQTSVSYDDANHVITTTGDQNSYNDNVLKSQLIYDGLGRTIETRQYEGGTNYIAVRRQYDSMGRVYKTSNPFRPWQSETAVWTTSAFDALGRVVSVTTPDSAVVASSYSGNTVTVTDQTGKSRKSVTDALGRLAQVYEDPSGLNYLTSYSYDPLDNLTTVSQGSQSRTFVYDSLKRLTSATNPESGTICYGTVSGGQCQANGYDANGNLNYKTDARGVVSSYVYDALNRNTNVSYTDDPAGTPTVNRYYDGWRDGTNNNIPNSIGRLWQTETNGSSGSRTTINSFDALGRPLSEAQQFYVSGAWSQSYTVQRNPYNLAGGVTWQTYPSQRSVSYTYDSAGRTAGFSGNLGDGTNRSYATGINYSPFGGLSKEQFGATAAVYHKLHYNIRGQLYDVRASNVNDEWGGELGALVNYYSTPWAVGGSGADNNGNVLGSQTIIGNSYMEDRYSYDSLNRLASVSEYFGTYTPSALTAQFAQVYAYDRYGNRTIDAAQTWGGVNNKQFTVNAANNRLSVPGLQSGTMTYDNAGNLTNDTYTGAGSRVYDAANRMTTAWGGNNQSQVYTYNADGQRVRRKVDNVETWQIYGFDGELLAEYAASGAVGAPQKEYGYRNGQLLITAAAAGSGWGAPPSFTPPATLVTGLDIKLEHLTELRSAVNDLRSHAGLSAFNFTVDPTPERNVTTVKADHIRQLRTALEEARSHLGLSTGGYAHPTLTENTTWIYATDFQELRDQILSAWNSGTAADIQWLVTDQLGTPRMIFDKTGALASVKRHDYLPFGEELFTGTGGRTPTLGYAADSIRQKFTSKERDNETGLDYFLARYYSSTQGRFTSPDEFTGGPHEVFGEVLGPTPLLYAEPTEPQSLNKYNYSLNNPLRYVDPDGHQTAQADGLIIATPRLTNIVIGGVKAVANIGIGMNNVMADFGAGNAKHVEPFKADNLAQAVGMVVTEDVSLIGGLLGGRAQVGGVAIAEAEGPAVVAAEVGNASRGTKTATQMAGELSDEIGKNSVSYTTPNKTGRIDLKGKSHFDKPTGQSIPTPHVQERVVNRSPGGGRVNTSAATTRPATKQDVRTARKIVERRENQ